ncbi:MAG: hypothetical protein ACYCZ6_00425 [Polaromonas sp.]
MIDNGIDSGHVILNLTQMDIIADRSHGVNRKSHGGPAQRWNYAKKRTLGRKKLKIWSG